MKRIRLSLLGSKTVIKASRRLFFTCVLRCHTSSLKGKGQKLLSSYSLLGAKTPVIWLANPNVRQFLLLRHLQILEEWQNNFATVFNMFH